MSDSIQVAIKVRPLIKREKDENLQIQWAVVDNVIVPVDPEKKRGENGFLFDHIFDPSKTNNDIFETVVKPIVDAAVKGFNGTVFAYGQTSSGKTYTMLGTSNESGVIPMAVERTFDSIAETGGREFLLRVSYLEIYNEKVNDLLDTTKVDLKLREDSNGLVQVLNCKEEIASSPDVIMAIMKKGDKNRRVGETDMNDRSSRSHTIFRITIESRDLSSDSDGAIQVSQLNLVDLAGSERARLTNATGERFKEGTHINQSLSTLGLVIKQLSESSDNNKYINFRDSKLTRILQASLGGNAMTTIICAVTPAAFEETQCTLSFASRAKSVKNKPQLNEVMSDAALLKRYKKQLAKLSEELEKVKNENRIVEAQEMESKLQEKEYKLQETHRINQILEERIQLLKNSIVSADSATKDNSSLKHSRFKRRRTWAGDRVLNYRFSTCSQNLPTINEISCTSPDSKSNNSEKLENVKRRKSIIQTVNFNDESFETAFTDFELELIKVAKEREEQTDTTIDFAEAKDLQKINLKPENRVKFQDNVEIFRLSSGSNWSDVSTPEKQRSSLSQGDRTQESSSPGTPKAVLRERLNYMIEEYNTLQEFTTLEKQMLFAQQVDFDSPTEKTFMQKQMDELLGRLGKYSSYQTELEELLTVSLNCINRLTSSTPGILELWKPTVFNDDKGEFDTCRELKQLEEILTNLKSEQSDSERALTPLEKKLTNDYNECLQELEQIRSQKQLLLIENIEIKKKLADESNKLKATDTLIKSLRVDTDCLMQKLIEKNNELVKLKKKIVQLERINDVTEKSVCISSPEVSTKNENEANMSTKLNLVDETQNKDFQISKLKEIIEEKALEIAKYRQFEEEMKIENERLQSLDAVSKLEEKGCQTQTIPNYENRNKSSLTIEQNQNKDAEISKLTNIIEEKALSIIDYQKREVEMKEKIEQLQQYLGDTAKVEKASQECQTENVFSYNEGSNLVEQNKEIMRLSEIIQEKTAEISNYKQYEEQMKEEIKPFLNVVTGSKIEQRSTECQTLYFQNHEENSKIDVSNKDTEIAKLEGVIEEKTLEITRLQQIEEESKKEIERLQFCLNSTNKIEKSSVECQSEDIFRDDVIEKNITNYLSHDKSNEISGLMELIHLKSVEIESYKKSEENMSEKIKQLQQCLGNVKKIEQNAKECQTETFAEQYIEVDTIKEKDNEISRLSEFIEEQTLVIEKYKILEEELKNNIEQLQNSLNVDKSGEVTSAECQTESMSNNETNFNQEKDNEISRLAGIVQEKTLEIEKCKISEEELKNNIEQLLHSLNAVKNAEISSAECQTESLPNNESNSNQEKDNEISRLSEVIEEKTLMIEKYKILEEELKNNIEQLQHSLNVVKNVDVISAECQTESMSNNESNCNQEKDNEISRLSEVIEEKTLMIEKYKILEEELKNNIEQLQKSQSSVKNTELISSECQTESTPNNESNSNQEKDNEISRLSKVIEEKTLMIEKYKILEEELKNNIEQLQHSLNVVKNVDVISAECQTESTPNNESNSNQEKDNEISRLSEVIEEKILMIEKYKILEEELKNNIEQLQQSQSSVKNTELMSTECHTEYTIDNKIDINHEKDNKICRLSEIIQEKTFEIEKYKILERELKNNIEQLQQSQSSVKNTKLLSTECQTECIVDNEIDINHAKDNEIFRLSEIIQEKALEIEKYKQTEEEMNNQMERLQQCLDNIKEANQTSSECQTEYQLVNESNTVEHNVTGLNATKDSEIAKLLESIQKKEIEIAHQKQAEVETRKEIERLQQCLDTIRKVEQMSKECQTDVGSDIVKYNKQDINAEKRNEISRPSEIITTKTLEIGKHEEIETLNEHAEILKEGFANARAEFEAKLTTLNDELITKLTDIDALNSLNFALRNGIDEKTNEIANLQQTFEFKLQKLEQKIDVIVLERNQLKEKIDSSYSNNLTQDFVKEAAHLKAIVDELKEENDILRKRLVRFETEYNNSLSATMHENLISLTSPIKSSDIELQNILNNSVTSPFVNLEENKHSISVVTAEKCENMLSHGDSFIKPVNVLVEESKDSVPVTTELNVSVAANNANLAKSVSKTFELESSSIFANLTYFDNMEVGQSFVQDYNTLLTGIDGCKDISDTSENINNLLGNDEIKNETAINATVLLENTKEVNKTEDIQSVPLIKVDNVPLTMEELEKINVALEKENTRLCYDLQKKIQETEEVQKVISDFKQTLEELQQTIYILTNENMDMSRQLTEARESNNLTVNNFQREIDTLAARLSAITEEKVSLKSELTIMQEQFENMRAITPVLTDDELKHKFFEYQEKIRSLTEENIELSTNLMEKLEELEKVKESKIQLYDHQCTYREKSELLVDKMQCLEKENIELSSELTEQIEECDKLKETVDVLKKQLEAFSNQQSTENHNKDDFEFFKQENTRLSNELIELRAKLTQLSRENANLSTHLVLNNSDEHNISTNISHSKPLNVSSIPLETSVSEEYTGETNKISFMNEKDKNLQEQVEHLTLLNKKLGELKLTNCSRCTHLKELNESRRLLKLEVKSLNQKLSDLQKKFQQKCADTEVWRMKANEDLNTSLNLIDATLNGSIYDGVNVTVIEEKVQNLHCELEELKENHNKLSNQYKEKCNELEKLQFDNNTIASQKSEKKETKRSKLDTPTRKHSSRIQAVEKQLDNLSNELQDLKKHNANVSSTLNKFMVERNELVQSSESLKLENEELRKECNAAKADALYYEEKVKLVEEELAALYKRIEVSNTTEKEIQAEKLKIEVQFESLLKEKSELTTSLQETEKKFRKELEECNTLVQNYEKENINLRNELQQLETVIQQLKGKKDNCAEEKLKQEIESAKSRILKEVRSLASLSENEIKELPTKSVTDIFLSFLTTILSKETEIVKRLQEEFERSKQKLEEEKQQCIDAERRANGWAKTLETDLEKLQGDLTEQEQKNRRLQNEIHRLADNLRESQHENQQLHNNIVNLEGDLNLLQNELDKKSKTNIDRDSVILAVQEKERLARTKEVEWENRLKLEKEDHNRELEELNVHLESYKSINEDLKNTVEGLDLEIEHLKNTIDIKTNDFNLCMHKLEEMQKVIEHLEESNQQLKIENLEKKKHADEITGLFKIKCDLLTEYKNKVETMKPEYENLHSQIAERKICIEKFKEEIHNLKLENKKQADILQDKLSGEEIKSAGLNKQVAELKNKNTALCSTIEEFKDRCAELERENASLQRKVRNSTSKVRVESEMQELQDENRSLKNHLEGSYNRIKELQETKSQVQRELMEAQGKNELLEQELNTTKIALGSLREKYNNMNLQKLREKYELLLREKNNVILEIEEKKMLIANKDQKLVEYSIEIDTLNRQKKGLDREVENIKRDNSLLQNQISDLVIEIQKLNQNISSCNIEKDEACKLIVEEKNKIALELENCQKEKSELMKQNKELDEEMDDLVKHIHKQEDEIAELQDRLITGSSSGIVEKLKILEDDNEKLKIDLRVTELNRTKLQNEVLRLNSEKEQLLSRIDDLNGRIAELESKNSSRSSSKTSSPTSRKGRRRNRRSDLYNQKRNLDFDSDSTESPSVTPTPIIKSSNEECSTCSELRNRIREMSLDLVSRNNKITMLEVQLQSENFPYQMKCNELQENLLAVKTRNSELKLEIHKLQRALMEDSSRECQMCRHRKLNRRDQSVQVNPEKKICLTGMSSGIVEDHIRLEKMEKERNWMKDLCRSRARKIKELEQHIKELEDLKTS